MTAAPEARTPSPNPPHKPATGTTHPPKPPPAATTTKTDEKRPSHDEVVSLSDEESSTEKTSSVDKWKRGQEARAQEAAKLKAEDKAFYEELTREDQQEEAEFMKLIKQDADDIRQARRIIRDARHLANRKAEPIHRSSCPESADVEPPLEYHQQAWEKEQRAKMPPASSKLAPARNGYQGPPVPSLQTSSSSASDDGDEDPYEESIRSSGVDSEGSITADEDDIRPPPDTLMHNGSHVRFKPKARAYPPKNNNGPAPPPTYDATAAGQQSSYDMNGPNPMDSPYDAPTPGSMSPTPNGSMGPPPEMTPYASKPALKSKRGPPPTGPFSDVSPPSKRLKSREVMDHPYENAVGFIPEDAEINFEDWQMATQRLTAEIEQIQPATAKLFRKFFEKIYSLHTPELWPSLRVYDIRVRSAHLGDTSTDLLHLDKRLLGTILIEESDDSLHHFHFGPGYEYDMHIADREADDIVDSPVKAGSINPFDEEEELESFLDEVYRGAGRFAKDFMGAGVTSPESFAEAALVDPQAIDELVDIVKVHASDMSPYLVIMLKKALKRRFATTTMPTRRP